MAVIWSYNPIVSLQSPSDVRLVTEQLCFKFGVNPPTIKWSSGRRRGIYSSNTDIITIGPKAWMGVTDTLLHCIAHVIVHRVSCDVEHHGLKFLETLWSVVLEYYKDPNLYSWYNEHDPIFEFGFNRLRNWNEDS